MAPAPSPQRKRRAYAARVPIEERRGQLREATLRVLNRDGYGAISIEAIAHEAGVTRPVVYSAYPNLEALLVDVLDQTHAEVLTQLLPVLLDPETAASGRHAIGSVARAWIAAVRSQPATWTPILVGVETPRIVHQRIEQGRDEVCRALAGLLASQDERATASGYDRLAAEAVVAAAEHFGRRLLAEPGSVDGEQLVTLFDRIVEGLYPPEPAR